MLRIFCIKFIVLLVNFYLGLGILCIVVGIAAINAGNATANSASYEYTSAQMAGGL